MQDLNIYRLKFIRTHPCIFYELMFEKFMHMNKLKIISKKAIIAWYNHATQYKIWKPFTLSKKCVLYLDKDPEYMLLYLQ